MSDKPKSKTDVAMDSALSRIEAGTVRYEALQCAKRYKSSWVELGEALRQIGTMASAAGLRVANVFHAGDGNLHPLILFDGRQPDGLTRAEALAGDILRMCVQMGGSITGEHGVGMEKRDYLPDMFSAHEIDCMQRIRAAFDPLGIANPGKMFPGGEAPALSHHGLHPLEKAGTIERM